MSPPAVELPALDLPAGGCWFVATPIGNLADVSLRALAVLAGVDVVYAEDTRRTRRLLAAYGIRAVLQPYHDHNKERVAPRIVERLRAGERVAVVSDAGMPAVADPGYVLIRHLTAAGRWWSVVPGPSSVLAALVLSGLPTDRFLFGGFPPRRAGRLRAFLAEMLAAPWTVVLLESCHRLAKTVAAVAELAPERELAVVREITKVHEEVVRGPAAAVLPQLTGPRLKGEVVLVLRGGGNGEA